MVAPELSQNPGEKWASYRRLEGPILNNNRGGVGSILGIGPSPPPEALNFAINLSNPYPRLAGKNGVILEVRWLPRIFFRIRDIVFREGPILSHNRGSVCPILGIDSIPPPEALNSTLNLSNP